MVATLPPRRTYSRHERLSDGVVHLLGLGLALLAVPVLIVSTVLSGAAPAVVIGASVYGVTLILMLTFSALYNMIEDPRWSGLLKRLDHTGIYVKIAGTYTPFTLLAGGQALGLLVGLWVAALIGLALKIVAPYRLRWLDALSQHHLACFRAGGQRAVLCRRVAEHRETARRGDRRALTLRADAAGVHQPQSTFWIQPLSSTWMFSRFGL